MALIQFNNIFKGFSGEYILKNLNFSVDEKDKIGLIGQNGAGKTTLVKMILGEESHDVSPETNVYGTITKKGNISIGYLSQNFDLNEESTIFDELLSVYSDVLDDHRKIEILNEKLATITYQKGLGSILKKSDRITGIFVATFLLVNSLEYRPIIPSSIKIPSTISVALT